MRYLLLILITLCSFPSLSQNKYKRDINGEYIINIGDNLPSFNYITLEGDTLDSDFLLGQPAIIQFVASWCPFSKMQLKAVQDLIWKKYNEKGLTVIAFTEDYPTDTASFRKLAEEKGITYQLSFDTDERIFKLFATSMASVTRLIVVDSQGKIVELEDEFSRKTFRKTRNTIKKLLKKH